MFVESEVIEATAQLIVAGIDDLPVEDDAEWHGWGSSVAGVMQSLIDELTVHDLFVALRSAAARLPEPAVEADEAADD